MRRLLVTAFASFGSFPTNASQLCLQKLLPLAPPGCEVTPRVYPVEFAAARPLLEADLARGYDMAIHLGQAQNTSRLRLEAVGLNVGAVPAAAEHEAFPLVAGGPAAYQTGLPLAQWAAALRGEGIPAYVSWHAGTYLCNATLYWGHHIAVTRGLSTAVCFVHVPLDVSQVAALPSDYLTLPSELAARGVARIVELWLEGR